MAGLPDQGLIGVGPIATPRLIRANDNAPEFKSYAEKGRAESPSMIAAELELCRAIGHHLARRFPGYRWGVKVDIPQGVAMIALPELMGPTGQYVLHLSRFETDTKLQCVTRAAGEILERFRLSRVKGDEGEIHNARATRRVRSFRDPFPT